MKWLSRREFSATNLVRSGSLGAGTWPALRSPVKWPGEWPAPPATWYPRSSSEKLPEKPVWLFVVARKWNLGQSLLRARFGKITSCRAEILDQVGHHRRA